MADRPDRKFSSDATILFRDWLVTVLRMVDPAELVAHDSLETRAERLGISVKTLKLALADRPDALKRTKSKLDFRERPLLQIHVPEQVADDFEAMCHQVNVQSHVLLRSMHHHGVWEIGHGRYTPKRIHGRVQYKNQEFHMKSPSRRLIFQTGVGARLAAQAIARQLKINHSRLMRAIMMDVLEGKLGNPRLMQKPGELPLDPLEYFGQSKLVKLDE